jgi:hypothetical protein
MVGMLLGAEFDAAELAGLDGKTQKEKGQRTQCILQILGLLQKSCREARIFVRGGQSLPEVRAQATKRASVRRARFREIKSRFARIS